jgi:hypothetical protein
MRPLQLDYLKSTRRSRLALWLLTAFAIGFAADTAWRYREVLAEIASKEVQLAKANASRPHAVNAAAAPAVSTEEIAVARETVRKISLPWNTLFQALEAAKTDRVALLAIEPDAESRTVVLSAEAKDYPAALAYVATLAEQKGIARVHLSRHEAKQSASPRPVAFTVSAAWKGDK